MLNLNKKICKMCTESDRILISKEPTLAFLQIFSVKHQNRGHTSYT